MKRVVEMARLEPRLIIDPASVVRCVRLLDQCTDFFVTEGTLEIAFVSEAECSRLHAAFFKDPDVTDVMTFPGDPEDQHAGDIAICPAVAINASLEAGLSFHEELTLYLVHAWLHLAGLDDVSAHDRKEMRRAEATLMDRLKAAPGLLDARWDAAGHP